MSLYDNPPLEDLNVLPPCLLELSKMLDSHDWFYVYSDDHRAYRKGADERADINTVILKCKDKGLGDAAESLFHSKVPDILR